MRARDPRPPYSSRATPHLRATPRRASRPGTAQPPPRPPLHGELRGSARLRPQQWLELPLALARVVCCESPLQQLRSWARAGGPPAPAHQQHQLLMLMRREACRGGPAVLVAPRLAAPRRRPTRTLHLQPRSPSQRGLRAPPRPACAERQPRVSSAVPSKCTAPPPAWPWPLCPARPATCASTLRTGAPRPPRRGRRRPHAHRRLGAAQDVRPAPRGGG
mmetsp:Transcript_19575/g.62020  ORF Transcript_19575/g.62020 Transcript_19575/m.62020 type:complete len:219 (-) Transcript_19575:1865-2521(-)